MRHRILFADKYFNFNFIFYLKRYCVTKAGCLPFNIKFKRNLMRKGRGGGDVTLIFFFFVCLPLFVVLNIKSQNTSLPVASNDAIPPLF